MSKDVTDELFPEVEGIDEAETEEAEAPEEVKAEQPEPEPEDEGEASEKEAGAPPAPEKEPENHVPVAALKGEREKRQAAERQIAELTRWKQQIETQAREHQLQSIENPDERMQALQQDLQQRMVAQKLDVSRRYAEKMHGADTIQQVIEFFNDPNHAPMSQQFLQTDDPFGSAVEYYNAQKTLQEIGPDPKVYEQKLREQIKAEILAELSPTKPKAPPPSMANAPASGGDKNPVGSAFDALFGDD